MAIKEYSEILHEHMILAGVIKFVYKMVGILFFFYFIFEKTNVFATVLKNWYLRDILTLTAFQL